MATIANDDAIHSICEIKNEIRAMLEQLDGEFDDKLSVDIATLQKDENVDAEHMVEIWKRNQWLITAVVAGYQNAAGKLTK